MTFRSKMLYSLSVVALFTTASIATAVLFVALGRADDADPAGKAPAKEAQPPTKVQSSNSTDEPAKPPKEAQAEIKTGNGFLHPPLECMKRFTRIDSYPIVGWCFHGKGGGGNDAEYVRTAKGAGFNVLLDAAELLTPAAEVGGVKVMPIVFRWPVDKLKSDLFARHPDSPVLLGLVLDDDCPQIYPWSINASNFLKSDYPHLVPYISENPHPKSQAKTQMPILSTQNYSIKNFGHKDYARRAYCSGMGRDRVAANKYHMTFWPLWVTPCSTCEMRYQIYAAMAYGAQGVVCFAYTPNRPNWKPNVDNYNDARDIHRTVADTFGPRVWGMRSPGVYHAPNADTPVTESKPAPGEIIERLETELLASPLVQEKDFYVEGGPHKPTYIMVVDKRTTEKNEDEPKPRTAHVEFGPQIKFVELLGPVTLPAGHIRHIDPAWSVPLELKAAGAAILGVDPPDMKQLLGDSADTYMAIVDRVRDMRQALRDKKIDLTAADKTLAEARSQAKDLAARVADAKPAAGEAAGQRQELVARLAARIDDLSTAIHLPPVETKPAAEPEMEPAPPMKAKKPKHK